jgi:serine/threonine protein kinase
MKEDLERDQPIRATPNAACLARVQSLVVARAHLEVDPIPLHHIPEMGQTHGPSEAVSPIVPGYEITSILGRGGMSVVYGALRVVDGQRVALKLPHLSGTEADVEKRLLREGRAASKLTGRHVARVLEVGVTELGAPFLALELLRGRDLARVLREDGPVPTPTAVEWMAQACDGLAEAHRNGVIHRDVKPSNLFLAEEDDARPPVIKILDFGLARALRTDADAGTDSTLTRSDAVIGSPRYLAPEVVRDADSAGPRSDVWSIGVVLYELCTGRPPFLAPTTAGVLARIVAEAPTPLEELLPSAPRALIRIVETALQKDPARRQASAEVLGSELRALSKHPRPSTSLSRRGLAVGLGVALLLLVGVFALELRSKPDLETTARDEAPVIQANAPELHIVTTQPSGTASVSTAPTAAVPRAVRREAPKSLEPAPKTAFDSPTVENRK